MDEPYVIVCQMEDGEKEFYASYIDERKSMNEYDELITRIHEGKSIAVGAKLVRQVDE